MGNLFRIESFQVYYRIATSGSSQIGDSGKNIQALAPDAKVVEGKRFQADVSVDEIRNWAEQF